MKRVKPTGGQQFEQLKMFMTPREIEAGWQPLDGDRHDTEYEVTGSSDTRAGEATRRSVKTNDEPNVYKGRDSQGYKYQRPSFDEPSYASREETDDELWDRKYDEAHVPREEYRQEVNWSIGSGKFKDSKGNTQSQGGRYTAKSTGNYETREPAVDEMGRAVKTTGGRRLYENSYGDLTHNPKRPTSQREETWVEHDPHPDSDPNSSLANYIHENGIHSPIRLGRQVGSQGKPQIVGGHHRMAVARQHYPDTLIPVLHDTDIHAAKADTTYKYT